MSLSEKIQKEVIGYDRLDAISVPDIKEAVRELKGRLNEIPRPIQFQRIIDTIDEIFGEELMQ